MNKMKKNFNGKKIDFSNEFNPLIHLERKKISSIETDRKNNHREIKLPHKLSGAIILSLCGVLFCTIPHPQSIKMGMGFLSIGLPVICNEICESLDKQSEEKRKEQIKKEQARKKEELHDCSQCSKKCRDCPYCRKRRYW